MKNKKNEKKTLFNNYVNDNYMRNLYGMDYYNAVENEFANDNDIRNNNITHENNFEEYSKEIVDQNNNFKNKDEVNYKNNNIKTDNYDYRANHAKKNKEKDY